MKKTQKHNLSYSKDPVYIDENEERKLYAKMKAGDEDARETLIMGHQYLVFKIAKNYSFFKAHDDLVQEGFVGLIRAVDTYDIEKGRLRSYSDKAIKTNILKYLERNRHIIRLPEPQTYVLLKLIKIRDRLEAERRIQITGHDLMQEPEVIQMHKEFQKLKRSKFTLKEFVDLLDFEEQATSLTAPINNDENYLVIDTIEDPRQNKEIENIDNRNLIDQVMRILSDREKFILQEVSNGLSARIIGEQLGVTAQAVNVVKLESIRKIKKFVKGNEELMQIVNELGFEV